MIVGFDLFLNNNDRYPIDLWKSEGNPENLLLNIDAPTSVELKDFSNLDVKFEVIFIQK